MHADWHSQEPLSRVPTDEDLEVDDPEDPSSQRVEIAVWRDGRCTGRDRGTLICDEGRLIFHGPRTSFLLPAGTWRSEQETLHTWGRAKPNRKPAHIYTIEEERSLNAELKNRPVEEVFQALKTRYREVPQPKGPPQRPVSHMHNGVLKISVRQDDCEITFQPLTMQKGEGIAALHMLLNLAPRMRNRLEEEEPEWPPLTDGPGATSLKTKRPYVDSKHVAIALLVIILILPLAATVLQAQIATILVPGLVIGIVVAFFRSSQRR